MLNFNNAEKYPTSLYYGNAMEEVFIGIFNDTEVAPCVFWRSPRVTTGNIYLEENFSGGANQSKTFTYQGTEADTKNNYMLYAVQLSIEWDSPWDLTSYESVETTFSYFCSSHLAYICFKILAEADGSDRYLRAKVYSGLSKTSNSQIAINGSTDWVDISGKTLELGRLLSPHTDFGKLYFKIGTQSDPVVQEDTSNYYKELYTTSSHSVGLDIKWDENCGSNDAIKVKLTGFAG